MQYKIRHYKIPYKVEGSGDSTTLILDDSKKELAQEESIESTDENILKSSTKIAEDNAKEKDLALAIGGEGFVITKILVE